MVILSAKGINCYSGKDTQRRAQRQAENTVFYFLCWATPSRILSYEKRWVIANHAALL